MMQKPCALLTLAALLAIGSVFGQTSDPRAIVQTVNTPRSFPEIPTRTHWENHAQEIRNQILVSCGLWPMPARTPLNAQVFGKVVRDGYSVEKVHFESYPGFFVAGNLYRPVGKGVGPFPAILNPHGHWENGRMADEKEGSIAARCIHFARSGMVAFSYDMVGYNDTFFPETAATDEKTIKFYERHRKFATDPSNLLWNINLMGLQTWNSIRALDFLESLPDVDKSRLACTGESGGGTQTFILGAIDSRLAATAPVVMVSHSMQGGCSCENAPGLRVRHSNMEIAACMAPKPQILVGATGDWTRDTKTVEGPAIAGIYNLWGAKQQLHYSVFDFRHNYNQTSREAVYTFFNEILRPANPVAKEAGYTKEPDRELRVFPNGKLPDRAISEAALIDYLKGESLKRNTTALPGSRKTLSAFKSEWMPAWKHTLQVRTSQFVSEEPVYLKTASTYTTEKFLLTSKGIGNQLPALLFTPTPKAERRAVLLVHPEGKKAFLGKGSAPIGLAELLVQKGYPVLVVDTFLTGELENYELSASRHQAELFFATYNVTDTQARVQDILTAATFLKQKRRGIDVIACGMGRAGLWTLLAAPVLDGVVADLAKADLSSDQELLAPDLFVPGLRKLGGLQTCALLAAPNPLYVHNAGGHFSSEALNPVYAGQRNPVAINADEAAAEAIVEWISALK